MMSPIKSIRNPVLKEIQSFDRYFRKSIKSNVKLLDIINRYIIKRKGKEIRPLLVFLSAKLCGKVNERTYLTALLVQLLHTATLVHDDVVDNAQIRRGFFSVNALWKSKAAVLVGDFLLAKGMLVALENKAYDLLHLASDAVRKMSEGELLQMEKTRKLDITENVYFDIIQKKTASLIANCTAAGAQSVGASKEVVKRMYDFGLYLGTAFQLKDDLMDFNKNTVTGKMNLNDIKEKKITLPLIFAFSKMSKNDKRIAFKTIKKYNSNYKKINALIENITQLGGLKYTQQKMIEYKNKSIELLNIFPDSATKNAIIALANYTTDRKK